MNRKSCQQLIRVDKEQLEPEDQDDERIIGLCFENEENMEAFIKAIELHRDHCYEEKHKVEMESHE